MCNITRYKLVMITSIAHTGLRLYYEDDNSSKLPSEFLKKIARILTSLDAVSSEEDILAMGSEIYKLSGDLLSFWSVKVSANYRIIFVFNNGDVSDVDYLDYH